MRKLVLLCSADEKTLKNVKFKSESNVDKYEYLDYFDIRDDMSLEDIRDITRHVEERLKDESDSRILVIREKIGSGYMPLFYRLSCNTRRFTSFLYLATVSYIQDSRTGTWLIEKYADDISLDYPTQEDLKRVMKDNDFYKDLLNQLNK